MISKILDYFFPIRKEKRELRRQEEIQTTKDAREIFEANWKKIRG